MHASLIVCDIFIPNCIRPELFTPIARIHMFFIQGQWMDGRMQALALPLSLPLFLSFSLSLSLSLSLLYMAQPVSVCSVMQLCRPRECNDGRSQKKITILGAIFYCVYFLATQEREKGRERKRGERERKRERRRERGIEYSARHLKCKSVLDWSIRFYCPTQTVLKKRS
jgi:hypothetical protein